MIQCEKSATFRDHALGSTPGVLLLRMAEPEPQFFELGQGGKRRRIAYRLARGKGDVELLWLSGFLSDMASTKAAALADWASAHGIGMLRFDYSGHGHSPGNLLEASIGDWLEEAIAAFGLLRAKHCIVIGSSMGGWIALLLARHLANRGGVNQLAGLVLIAPA